MKKMLLLFIMYLSGQVVCAQNHSQDSTLGFSFQINYWFNLHHFLWMESFLNLEADSSLIRQTFSPDSQKKLKVALGYYKDNLTTLNLRSSDYMTDFKHWITTQDLALKSVPPNFKAHIEALKDVSEVYKTFFWPKHQAACKKVLDDNIELIRKTEERFASGIRKLTRQPWQREKIRVDITYYGTASTWNIQQRPYTTIFPTHVVMTAVGENDIEGNWVELLYHEAAHHLILSSSYFVGGTIKDVCEVMNIEPPRSFWHAYLFYLTGELTQQIFQEENLAYEHTYMERNGVYSRYYSLLDLHLKSYMERDITLEEATRKILTELNQ